MQKQKQAQASRSKQRLYEKVCEYLRKHAIKESGIINRRAARIIWLSFYHKWTSGRIQKRENTEKNITFAVPIENQVKRIDKNGQAIIKHISYILRFIDSWRFMSSSLSNLVSNLSEGTYRSKWKSEHDDKKY